MPRSNPELAMAMGKRMVARRKELGLTQETVADIAGIAYQQYNKAENGKVCVGADSLIRISAALQTSADYLLIGKHRPDRHSEITAILDRLSDRQLKLANQVLACMVQFGDSQI